VRRSTNLPLRKRAALVSVPALLLVLRATVGLAACGSSPTKAPSISIPPSVPASFDCALLPTADLSKIVGGEVTVAEAMPSSGWVAGQCALHSPTSVFFVSVGTAASIKAFGDPAAPNAKAKLAQFKQLAPTRAREPAPWWRSVSSSPTRATRAGPTST
jgi:hypothetical protein